MGRKLEQAHLVSHDHEVAIAQGLAIAVHFAVLQPQDLLDVVDLRILQRRGERS